MDALPEGFGFNTNLLETNILNLAVVIPLVFLLGKDTLTTILDIRLEKILGSLRSADDRFKQAQLQLDAAKAGLTSARQKVIDIQSEARKTIKALRIEETKRYEDLHHRFAKMEKDAIRFEEEKIVTLVRQEIIAKSFDKAIVLIRSTMTPEKHVEYNNAQIGLMKRSLANKGEKGATNPSPSTGAPSTTTPTPPGGGGMVPPIEDRDPTLSLKTFED
jgi:F-type H+-transporting ATPase subunit b